MSRSLKSFFVGFIVVVALLLLAPRWIGSIAHNRLNHIVTRLNADNSSLHIALKDYQSGWFHSQAALDITDSSGASYTFDLHLAHGPIIFDKGLHVALMAIDAKPMPSLPWVKSLFSVINFTNSAKLDVQLLFPPTSDKVISVNTSFSNLNKPSQIDTQVLATDVYMPNKNAMADHNGTYVAKFKLNLSAKKQDDNWQLVADETVDHVKVYLGRNNTATIGSAELGKLRFEPKELTQLFKQFLLINTRSARTQFIFAHAPQLLSQTLTANSHITVSDLSMQQHSFSMKLGKLSVYAHNLGSMNKGLYDSGLIIKNFTFDDAHNNSVDLSEFSFNHYQVNPAILSQLFVSVGRLDAAVKHSVDLKKQKSVFKQAMASALVSMIAPNTSVKMVQLKVNGKYFKVNGGYEFNFKDLPHDYDLYNILYHAVFSMNMNASLNFPHFVLKDLTLDSDISLSQAKSHSLVSFDQMQANIANKRQPVRMLTISKAKVVSKGQNDSGDYSGQTLLDVPEYCLQGKCYKNSRIKVSSTDFLFSKRIFNVILDNAVDNVVHTMSQAKFKKKEPVLSKENQRYYLKSIAAETTNNSQFKLDELFLSTPLGEVSAKAQINFTPYLQGDVFDWFENLPMSAHVKVNQSVLAKLHNAATKAMLKALLQQGYLSKEGDSYVASLQSKLGVVYVNNKRFDLKTLQTLQEKHHAAALERSTREK